MLRVAVVGAGAAGACAAWALTSSASPRVRVDVFDQGRRGPGGRASRRNLVDGDAANGRRRRRVVWEHGCQFFRADSKRFRDLVSSLPPGAVREWRGDFVVVGEDDVDASTPRRDFFGFPRAPPFYYARGGTLPDALLRRAGDGARVFDGTRAADARRGDDGRWRLYGATGPAAYHDTPSSSYDDGTSLVPIGRHRRGYDALLCTDASSSFESWHRASAGLPADFAARVRARIGARTPLFTCGLAFDGPTRLTSTSAVVFRDHPTLWFAGRNNSKQLDDDDDDDNDDERPECWTLVSTPEFAIRCVRDEPMRDAATGAFLPQTKEYLFDERRGPGAILERAFLEHLSSSDGDDVLPRVAHRDAQRWGSALPARRDGGDDVVVVAGTAYDAPPRTLAPTVDSSSSSSTSSSSPPPSFVADDELRLYQAGDAVSADRYAPGLEAAALSGLDAAEHILKVLSSSS